jgi:hypothetical protein
MNVSLASQLESPLLNSLQSSIVSKPFNYSLTKNYPLLSKSNISVAPVVIPSGVAYNKKTTWKIPKYGLCTGMAIKTTVLGAGTPDGSLATRASRIGSRLFSNVSLRSHNRVVQDNDSEYLDHRISNESYEKQQQYTEMTTPVPAIADTVTSTVYTPLRFFFSERSEAALDLQFCEPLEVVATFNSQSGIWGTTETTFNMSIVDIELVVYYVNLENETQSALTASQFPLSQNLTVLANDSYVEIPVDATGTASTEDKITLLTKTNHVVTASHFRLRRKDTNALITIDKITMVSSGQTLVDSNRLTGIYENAQYGNMIANVPASSAGEVYSIHYGMSSDKTYISGAQAFGSLNSPVFEITADLPTGVVCELSCQHDYAMLLTVNSSDGSLQRSLAN